MGSPPHDHIVCRYAVALELNGAPASGALVVTDDGLVLSGRQGGAPFELRVPRGELRRVRIGRSAGERMNGYKTIVLERRGGPDLLVAPFGLALLHEVADLISSIAAPASQGVERVDLLVPIKRGSGEHVRRLTANGPPFDPAALGLRRHDVYLSETQVRFVFEGTTVQETLGRTVTDPAVWRAGLAWRSHISGRPRIAEGSSETTDGEELIYSWRSESSC